MLNLRNLLAAALLTGAISGAQAQTAPPAAKEEDRSVHHPADVTAQATPAPTPAPMAPGAMPPGGMMGGDMGAMMQSMMPMMRMMMAQDAMMGGAMERMDGPMQMMAPERIEGRLAFLKAELKITEAQLSPWNALADVMRANAKAMQSARGAMMQPAKPLSAPDRMDQHVKTLTGHLDAARSAVIAVKTLYGALNSDQRKTADALLVPPMGRM